MPVATRDDKRQPIFSPIYGALLNWKRGKRAAAIPDGRRGSVPGASSGEAITEACTQQARLDRVERDHWHLPDRATPGWLSGHTRQRTGRVTAQPPDPPPFGWRARPPRVPQDHITRGLCVATGPVPHYRARSIRAGSVNYQQYRSRRLATNAKGSESAVLAGRTDAINLRWEWARRATDRR